MRRASSVSVNTTATQGFNLTTAGGTAKINATFAAANFTVTGFTTGMRIKVNSTKDGYEYLYTAKAVAATVIDVHEMFATGVNATNIGFTGYTMETIGDVVGWNGPGMSMPMADITNLSNTAKNKLPVGAYDGGQVTIDFNFDIEATARQMLIQKDLRARTARYYDIVFTDVGAATVGSYCAFQAYPSGYSIQGSVDNPIKGSITLDISGVVQYTTRR